MVFMRRRPLLRAAVVGGGAYAMGRRSAERSADEQYQAEQQAPAPESTTEATPSMADQLNQLTVLHQRGALTDEEFSSAKARLLGS